MPNNNFAQKMSACTKLAGNRGCDPISGSRPRRSATALNGGRECSINQFGTAFRGIVQPHSKIGPIGKEHNLPVPELTNKQEK